MGLFKGKDEKKSCGMKEKEMKNTPGKMSAKEMLKVRMSKK